MAVGFFAADGGEERAFGDLAGVDGDGVDFAVEGTESADALDAFEDIFEVHLDFLFPDMFLFRGAEGPLGEGGAVVAMN